MSKGTMPPPPSDAEQQVECGTVPPRGAGSAPELVVDARSPGIEGGVHDGDDQILGLGEQRDRRAVIDGGDGFDGLGRQSHRPGNLLMLHPLVSGSARRRQPEHRRLPIGRRELGSVHEGVDCPHPQLEPPLGVGHYSKDVRRVVPVLEFLQQSADFAIGVLRAP